MQSKLSENERLSSFSIFHNNFLSINKNLENLQTQILEDLEFHFDIRGISETKTTNSNSAISVPTIPGYNFEFVPTPLASGGVALFMYDRHGYRILEKTSNEVFQALWVEMSFVKKKNIIQVSDHFFDSRRDVTLAFYCLVRLKHVHITRTLLGASGFGATTIGDTQGVGP